MMKSTEMQFHCAACGHPETSISNIASL